MKASPSTSPPHHSHFPALDTYKANKQFSLDLQTLLQGLNIYIYIFSLPNKKKFQQTLQEEAQLNNTRTCQPNINSWLWVLSLGLPIIGDLVVSGQTMGRHLLLVCMSQRPSEMLFPNKRVLTQRQVFCLKLWKISQAFLHSNKISRPCSGHSCSTLWKKKNSS